MKKIYLGVNGVAKKVKKAYIGMGNTLEYNTLEYIESSGVQYINTRIIPDSNTKISVTAELISGPDDIRCIAGTRNGSTENFWIFWGGKDMPSFYARYNTNLNIDVSGTFSGKHTFTLDCNAFSIDGVSKNTGGGTLTSSNPICLFGLGQQGSAKYFSTMRLYDCKIWQNEVLVRDFVPAKFGNDAGLIDKIKGIFYPNLGGGTFLEGAFKENVTQKNSVARRIKKGYIGVGNTARPFFSSELSYWGLATPIFYGRPGLSSASTDKYAFFAGGEYAANDCETYDRSLTYKSIEGLTEFVKYAGATRFSDNVLFAGGLNFIEKIPYGYVEKYDNSLTKSVLPESLSVPRGHIASLEIGDYAVFAGGLRYDTDNGDRTVDYFDKSDTHFVTELPSEVYGLCGAKAGNIGIFYGENNRVYAFDSSMTLTIGTDETEISPLRNKLFAASATLDDYAVFAGGQQGAFITNITLSALDIVKVYDSSLTRVALLSLKNPSTQLAGASAGDYAVFAGGMNDSAVLDDVNCFDTSFTLRETGSLTYKKRLLKSAVVGNYLLFTGGYSTKDTSTAENRTEVFIF